MKDRPEWVLEILERHGYRSVTEIAQEMHVSFMTIRRSLDRLEADGRICRTHGGAFVGRRLPETDYRLRETIMRSEKEAIGRAAAAVIQPGESVFIDAGTTAAALALSIGDVRGTTIITNSLDAAQALKGNVSVETVLLGGRIHTATRSLVGPLALENIRRFHFAKAFLGANGVCSNSGFSQSTLDEVPIKRCAAENASEVYILADSSKFNNQHLILFLETEKATAVITDTGASGSDRTALEEKGLKVIIAT